MTEGLAVRPVMTGGSASLTVTSNEHVAPVAAEVAVTVVVPIGKKLPEAGDEVTTPQLPSSDAAGYVTTAPGEAGSVPATTSDGHVSVQVSVTQTDAAVVIVSDHPPAITPMS